jgi:SAM-dependent methyltransferase
MGTPDEVGALQRGRRDGLDHVLARTREAVAAHAPELLDQFDLYASEAAFGRELIDADLRHLPSGTAVLEVGAGALLLACGLAAEGFRVVAIEPTDAGFGHMARLGECCLAVAGELGISIELFRIAAEQYHHVGEPVGLAFGINVMEHVADPARVIHQVTAALAPGGVFHFVCPNYHFPYEPHFNSPTLGTRALTERFLARRWIARATFPDPAGTFASLNWITTSTVRRAVGGLGDVETRFEREALKRYFDRASDSASFAARKGATFKKVADIARRLGLLRLLNVVPSSVLPVIDCRITQRSHAQIGPAI